METHENVQRYVEAVASDVLNGRNDVVIVTYDDLRAFETHRNELRSVWFAVTDRNATLPVVVRADGPTEGISHPSLAKRSYESNVLAERIVSLDLSYGYVERPLPAANVPAQFQATMFVHTTDPHRYHEACRATSKLLDASTESTTPIRLRFKNVNLHEFSRYGPFDVITQQLCNPRQHDKKLRAQRNEIIQSAPDKAHANRVLEERIRDAVFSALEAF